MIKVEKNFLQLDDLIQLAGNTPAGKWQERILAQLKFVCILSEKNHRKYEGCISEAVTLLEEALRKQGVITREIAETTEKILLPAAQEAKSYRFLCIAHAHIDMNWMWGFEETVGTTMDTFRTMLNIMGEYPDYKFSQSQASVYKIIEEYDPDMLEEIKEQVRNGRWEITASTWVETDKNMPSGESLTRHILYTKDYISKTFDINPDNLDIDFEPDTFGHSQNVPEILTRGGVRFYYHCRGHVGEKILYRWRAPSGAEVILYTEPFWYNSFIDDEIANHAVVLEEITGSRTLLKVYGVGDHGGGPTRRDVEKLIEMDSWPVYPQFVFSTLRDYFKTVEPRKDTLPILEGEINFLCDGCYTTQSRIKAGNRKSEALLNEAELFSAMSAVKTGSAYPGKALSEAWIKTLFNQFHDILPGSGVTETREYASGLFQQVFAAAQSKSKIALKQITDSIDTAAMIAKQDIKDSIGEGAGSGYYQCGRSAGKNRIYHVFNPSMVQRTEPTEIVIWDYEGRDDAFSAVDPEGKAISSQVLEKGAYWDHKFTRILIDAEVPPCGYATYILGEKREYAGMYSFSNDMRVQSPDRFVLENEIVRAELSSRDGSLLSYRDKRTEEEFADLSRSSCVFSLVYEAVTKAVTGWAGGMSAWFVGRYKKVQAVNDNIEIKMAYTGPLRSAIQYQTSFMNSKLTVEVYLDKNSDALQFNVECDWREFGSDLEGVPALHFNLPLNYKCENYLFDVPFGTVARKEMDMDLPANSFVIGQNDQNGKALMLACKTKYGYRCCKDTITLTLIRGSYDPDPTPETGRHKIQFEVKPVDSGLSNSEYLRHSYHYNHPLVAFSGTPHPGSLPHKGSFLKLEKGSVMVSAVKLTEADKQKELLVRMYETDGNLTQVQLQAEFEILSAEFVDSTEHPLKSAPEIHVDGRTLIFEMKPYQVATISIMY